MSHSNSKHEVQKLVDKYQKFIFDNGQQRNEVSPMKLRKMIFNLHDAYKEGATPASYDHWQTVAYLYELTQLTRCSDENFDKFERATERNKERQNVVAFVTWQLKELKNNCIQEIAL